MKLEGIHHITAITGQAQQNVDFYVGTLGLRMVKKTVNQDDPSVYHLFYADEDGDPGSDLTFFEYPGAAPEGLRHELRVSTVPDQPLIADHPEIPKEVALLGFDGVRAYSGRPEASRERFEQALAFEAIDAGWEGRGSSRGGTYVFDHP